MNREAIAQKVLDLTRQHETTGCSGWRFRGVQARPFEMRAQFSSTRTVLVSIWDAKGAYELLWMIDLQLGCDEHWEVLYDMVERFHTRNWCDVHGGLENECCTVLQHLEQEVADLRSKLLVMMSLYIAQ